MYTHYLEKQITALNQEQRDIANRLYRALLATIEVPEAPHLTLLDIIQAKANHIPVMYHAGQQYDTEWFIEKYFHEFAFLPRTNEAALFPDVAPGNPSTWWEFLKTDRKLYDLAVFMTLQAVFFATWVQFTNDGMYNNPGIVLVEEYLRTDLGHLPLGSYDINRMAGIQSVAVAHIKAAAVVLPWLPIPDPEEVIDDETRIGHLTIYGKVNVWDLRHIADMIEKWELFSPADWSYQGQPSWVFTKS